MLLLDQKALESQPPSVLDSTPQSRTILGPSNLFSHFSFDHLSVSKDVPYGDTFYIVTRYEVTKKGNGCMLQVATAVKFTKTVWGMKGWNRSSLADYKQE